MRICLILISMLILSITAAAQQPSLPSGPGVIYPTTIRPWPGTPTPSIDPSFTVNGVPLGTIQTQAAAGGAVPLGSMAIQNSNTVSITGGIVLGADASGANITTTGTTTPRTAGARAADAVNVRDFGAKGDCSTDDSAAFNAAFSYIRSHGVAISGNYTYIELDVPAGCYVIAHTINATGLRDFSTRWDFHGATLWGKTNGSPVIDAFGSRFMNVRDLDIYGDATLTPSIGFQHGVVQNSPFSACDDNHFDRIAVYGNFTFTSWYNRNSEVTVFVDMQLRNTNSGANAFAYVADGSNYWNVPSAFITISYPQSTATTFLGNTWINPDIRNTGGGHAVWFNGGTNHRFINGYLQSLPVSGSAPGVATVPVASGGSGYTSVTVTFPAPPTGGLQAAATGTLTSGALTAITITNPGYYPGIAASAMTPTVTGTGYTVAATVDTPTTKQIAVEPLEIYVDRQSPSWLYLDLHMETTLKGNILIVKNGGGAVTINGLEIIEPEPFAESVLTADVAITNVTVNNMKLELGGPTMGGAIVFGTPALFSVQGQAMLLTESMWNRPDLAQMSIAIPGQFFGSLNMGRGSYQVMDTNGIYLKGTVNAVSSNGTPGFGSGMESGSNTTFINGLFESLRSAKDYGLRMGSSPSSPWEVTVAGDGSTGLAIATGGTTAGGTQAAGFDAYQNVVLGLPSPATNATAGFLYIPKMAGAPTGVPTVKIGFSPIVYDATDGKLCLYNGAAWKCATLN